MGRKRRTLGEVWADDNFMKSSITYCIYNNEFFTAIGNNLCQIIFVRDLKGNIFLYSPTLVGNCFYETFPQETKMLNLLFGQNKK